MIATVHRHGLEVGPADVVAEARARFARDCCVLLPGFLAPDLLHAFRKAVAAARWQERVHRLITNAPPPTDLVLEGYTIDGQLLFLLNDSRLFRFVENLTGCAPIGSYEASVYRMTPGQGHVDAWHSDDDGNQMVALSINLSEAPFEGGVLQIRNSREDRVIHKVQNTGAGNAVLFRIADHLDHRVTEVTGTMPRTAFAGWFKRHPPFSERFLRRPLTSASRAT